jgi:hypothetical protein
MEILSLFNEQNNWNYHINTGTLLIPPIRFFIDAWKERKQNFIENVLWETTRKWDSFNTK